MGCCKETGKGCQDHYRSKMVFKNLLGEHVVVGFMEERLNGDGHGAELIDRTLPAGSRPSEAFLLRPNQEREFEVPYKNPIVFAKDTQGNDIQRHPAPESGMINVGNITQYETLWSKTPCFLPEWLLVYVPK